MILIDFLACADRLLTELSTIIDKAVRIYKHSASLDISNHISIISVSDLDYDFKDRNYPSCDIISIKMLKTTASISNTDTVWLSFTAFVILYADNNQNDQKLFIDVWKYFCNDYCFAYTSEFNVDELNKYIDNMPIIFSGMHCSKPI